MKVENTRALGARVILEGATFEDSARITRNLARDEGYTFIHPFDDPVVIAGQGTIALEMLSAAPDLDDLVLPIGGGGLISGMGTAAKTLEPDIRIIGIEAGLYPSMYNLVKHASLPIGGDTLAEGIAVKEPGALTRAIIARVVDDIMLVSEAEIERAVSLLIGIEKTVVEGAGAAGLAAIIADPHRFRGRKVGLVLCGGNIDSRLLASVLTRELAATDAWPVLPSTFPIVRANSPRSRASSAVRARTSSKSITSACLPTCPRRAPNSIS